MLEWDEKYSTGYAEIDDQHKKLFQVINQLGKSLEEGAGEDKLDEIIAFLEEYAQMHFGQEEECMAREHCPMADRNKRAHQLFIKGIDSYRERLERFEDKKTLINDIHLETERWIVEHICKIDIALRDCRH